MSKTYKLIFEKSIAGHGQAILPESDVPVVKIPKGAERTAPLPLPEIGENDLSRHYTELAERTHGVNKGFYPLGSCTMKYNPKINEDAAALPGFRRSHPLAPDKAAQGNLELLYKTQEYLAEITGMDAITLSPAAGAHGEFTGVLLIKAYHTARGDTSRTKIIVPDSAHGTNPATAAMCGYQVISIPSGADGCVDLSALREAVGPDTAGLMLTNPNTVGIFDKNILEITKIVHDAGGLNYYDGANLNAIMGVVRPGDMGFDVVHINLHKTFSTPHGGGGPGSGPVGCKAILAPFLPGKAAIKKANGYALTQSKRSIGAVKAFTGNFGVIVRAFTYLITLGAEGIKQTSQTAVLNANYMKSSLSDLYKAPYDGFCMHEFVVSLEAEKESIGVSAMDIAKTLLDYGMHPPTMYFPLIVHEALMIEPTETESKAELDRAIAVYREIYERAIATPAEISASPKTTVISRPDEVAAARTPRLRYAGK
jgi:glycine dehydrogenase subunit 2